MITKNSPLSKIDPDAGRRLILAKVYKLLIRLADEAENDTDIPDVADTEEEKIGEPTSVQSSPLNAEV